MPASRKKHVELEKLHEKTNIQKTVLSHSDTTVRDQFRLTTVNITYKICKPRNWDNIFKAGRRIQWLANVCVWIQWLANMCVWIQLLADMYVRTLWLAEWCERTKQPVGWSELAL